MKIAVLGANGFVGQHLVSHLTKHHTVFPLHRRNINLLNTNDVFSFLNNESIDVVINAAAKMTSPDSLEDAVNNLGVFMNFHNLRSMYGKFINLCSGAALDRSRSLNNSDKTYLFDSLPRDGYGFSMNVKAKLCLETKNFYNIRIFNCFGHDEAGTRIFPQYLKSQGKFEIQNDRLFDYIGISDLCTIVEHCATNDWCSVSDRYSDVNAVYSEKYTISEVVIMFRQLHGMPMPVVINSTGDFDYTGSSATLDALLEHYGITLRGLEYCLSHYFA